MITIPVDEAYAFDYLSIQEVKKSSLVLAVAYHVKCQVGSSKFNTVIASQEYKDLYTANLNLFDCVERARYGTISARELDEANMQRHYAKQAVQKAHFDNELTELKT